MEYNSAKAKVTFETIRNALAHGGKRISLTITPGLQVHLNDIYHKVTPLGLTTDLRTINTLLSDPVFDPKNIKLKEKGKTLTKK